MPGEVIPGQGTRDWFLCRSRSGTYAGSAAGLVMDPILGAVLNNQVVGFGAPTGVSETGPRDGVVTITRGVCHVKLLSWDCPGSS